MPYVGGEKIDKRLRELKERQASRRSEVAAANKREEVKLTAVLEKLDCKHDKDMININTKLHVTKIDLVREIQRDTNSALLQQVKKGSKHLESKKPTNFQSKSAKFGAMKVPSQLTYHRSNDTSPMPRVYPFHLINSEHNNLAADLRRKKQLPPISPRQFPILAAKYYRESQICNVKRKSSDKLSTSAGILHLLQGNRDDAFKKPKSQQSDVVLEENSLPPVSLPGDCQSYPPQKLPKSRINVNDSVSRSNTAANDPSDEELQRLRNGQYFLRYSSVLDDGATESSHAGNDLEPLEVKTEEKAGPQILRVKSCIDDAITLVEDCNKPKEA